MANNCLVTTLKGVVNNDNLNKLGEIIFEVKNATGTENNITMVFSDGQLAADATYTTGELTSIATGDGTALKLSGTGKLHIKSKYKLTNLTLGTTKVELPRISDFDFSQLNTLLLYAGVPSVENEPLSSLAQFSMVTLYARSCFKGDIVELLPMSSSLGLIDIEGNNAISGTMTNLGLLTSLTSINIFNNGFAGAIEDFVGSRFKNGQSSGSLSLRVNRIEFNGSSVTKYSLKSLTWSASGSNTVVTYDGVSTTIHINLDGTWTRVS